MGTVAPPATPKPSATPIVEPPKKSSWPMRIAIGFVVILVVLLLSALAYFYVLPSQFSGKQIIQKITAQPTATPTPAPTATPTPAPTPTPTQLKAGPETYTVSQSKRPGPVFSLVTFDPLDVKKGQTLTLTITFKSAVNLSTVTAKFEMDHGSTDITFKKTDDPSGLVWRSEILMTDSVWYKYIITVFATDQTGTNNVWLAPRS